MLTPLRCILILALMVPSISSCTFAPGCYIGVSIFPPGPFVHCGLESAPKTDKKDGE